MAEEIQVLIADDHAVVREGLRSLINSEPGMKCLPKQKMVSRLLINPALCSQMSCYWTS